MKDKVWMNRLINNLPVELHISGYQYYGPGTKLQKDWRVEILELTLSTLLVRCTI